MMDNLKYDNLEIITKEEPGTIKLLWQGSSDSRNPATVLGTYLDKILATGKKYNTCAFDFSGLDFMNSSTIATILHTIKKMKNHPAKFQLIFSKTKEWQEISFRTMRIVTSRMGNITVHRE